MMTNLFSSFDLNITNTNSPLSLMLALMPCIMYISLFWQYPPQQILIHSQLSQMVKSLIVSTNLKNISAPSSIMNSVLYTLIVLNLSGAMPYQMTLTSHLAFTLSLGLPLWTTLIMISNWNSFSKTQAKYLPENTPMAMSWFLALVEVLSSVIRPITLSFRLAANISAGHVILGMMTSTLCYTLHSMLMNPALFSLMTTSTLYSMFEFMICLVQAFVFTLLTSMYANDYISDK